MKNLKTYSQLFENSQELTPEHIEWLDACTKDGTWKLNPETGEVDVDGSFYCYGQGLTDFKGFRFGVVGLDFNCGYNRLTSLEGAPNVVGGGFYCYNNRLTSLEGAPKVVGKSFNCYNNQLTSLEGAPQEVGGDFFCYDNPVTNISLKKIFSHMKSGKSYLKAVETLWNEIPLEDQSLLYRQGFEWVSPEFGKKLDVIKAYQGFKDML